MAGFRGDARLTVRRVARTQLPGGTGIILFIVIGTMLQRIWALPVPTG
jgi:hypothetical protein